MPTVVTALLDGRGQGVALDGVRLAPADLLGAAGAAAHTIADARRVAVHATATPDTVVAVIAGLLAGVPVVPVPADAGSAERGHIVTDSAAECWLGDAPRDAAGLSHHPVDLAARASYPSPDHDAADVALVLYTSGTTGAPKGVLISRGAIAADIDALADAWAWTHDDVLAHGLPLSHVHGLVLGVLGPLRVGSGLVHVGRPTPQAYAAAADDGATMFFGVPTVWNRLAEAPESAASLRHARLLVSGSAALPRPVLERLRASTGHDVLERYGMSESLITVAARVDGDHVPGTVGVPLRGVETRLRDDLGAPVAHDGESVGHLEVRGPTLFAGYLGRDEATAASYTDDGWFRTGDVATIDLDGLHRIVGRASVDLIKSGGYRIGAGEIEASLLDHPAVAECAVVGVPDADLGQRIVAHVVRRPGVDVDAAALIDHVGAQLSAHKRPREVRFVDVLPRNALGKVVKTALT